MQIFKTIVSLSALAGLAAAQLQFDFTFSSVTAGQPVNVTFSGDGGQPVTIILREGSSTNLNTIGTLTTSATGGSYIWTPSTTLPSASDYALEIQQGSTINYSAQFSIVGGSSSSASANSTITVGPISTATGSATTGGNSTFSSPTLTRGTTTVITGVTASGSTGSASTSTSAPSTNSAAGVSSSLTLVFAVVAALAYFN